MSILIIVICFIQLVNSFNSSFQFINVIFSKCICVSNMKLNDNCMKLWFFVCFWRNIYFFFLILFIVLYSRNWCEFFFSKSIYFKFISYIYIWEKKIMAYQKGLIVILILSLFSHFQSIDSTGIERVEFGSREVHLLFQSKRHTKFFKILNNAIRYHNLVILIWNAISIHYL